MFPSRSSSVPKARIWLEPWHWQVSEQGEKGITIRCFLCHQRPLTNSKHMITSLYLFSLENSRTQQQLILFNTIKQNLVNIQIPSYIVPSNVSTRKSQPHNYI